MNLPATLPFTLGAPPTVTPASRTVLVDPGTRVDTVPAHDRTMTIGAK
jgi:hypothetical protein